MGESPTQHFVLFIRVSRVRSGDVSTIGVRGGLARKTLAQPERASVRSHRTRASRGRAELSPSLSLRGNASVPLGSPEGRPLLIEPSK